MTTAPAIGGFTPSIRALLARGIDYAGLFPPAKLDLPDAVANYLTYRDSADRWALGRFVVPAARLPELAVALRATGGSGEPIPLSVVIGARVGDDGSRIAAFRDSECGPPARIESVEVRAPSGRGVSHVLGDVPFWLTRYVEVPVDNDPEPILQFVALAGVFAKVRTGGTAPEAFPKPEALLGFLTAAARRRLPFKATAGLHHPLRGTYRLTHDPDAARATMYGFLNLALASALLWKYGDAAMPQAAAALRETDPATLGWDAQAIRWRDERFDAAFLAGFRREFFHGFGSCSFREPLDELAALSLSQVGPSP